MVLTFVHLCLSLSLLCEIGKAHKPWGCYILHRMGATGASAGRLSRKLSCPRLALQFSLPVDVLGTASLLFSPLIPICSATAQIQFRRRVPPASSQALSPRTHSNPPKQRLSNLNKPSDISLAVRKLSRTVPTPTSFKPFGFADLCLSPQRNTPLCHR